MYRNKKGQFSRRISYGSFLILGGLFALILTRPLTIEAEYKPMWFQEAAAQHWTICETNCHFDSNEGFTDAQAQVELTPTPEVTVQPKVLVQPNTSNVDSEIAKIYRHTLAYKGRYTKELLYKILAECGSIHNVKVAVAISTQESSQGLRGIGYNWWGYDRSNQTYKNNQTAMIKGLCTGLKGKYKNLIVGGKVNIAVGHIYNADKDISGWVRALEWSYSKMN